MKHSAHSPVQPEVSTAVKYEVCFNEEQKHLWTKMIQIEKLKKETSERKTLILRGSTRRINA